MSIYVLDSTTKTIIVNMVSAAQTTNPDYVVGYADSNGTVFTEGSADGALNGTTNVTVCSAPAPGYRRIIKSIDICNRDNKINTVRVIYNNNGTQRIIANVTLGINETYTLDGTYDSSGALKTTLATVPEVSGFSGFILNSVASSITVSGFRFGYASALVRFTSNATVADVAATPVNQSQLTVAVPSQIYSFASGITGTLQVITANGFSSNQIPWQIGVSPTGGTISVSGGFRTHVFTTSDNFVVSASYIPTTISYLIVGGGGGGGQSLAGGGGGGGIIQNTGRSIAAGSFPVIVGGGGANRTNGSPSSFYGESVLGGGGGGERQGGTAPQTGGANGGGGNADTGGTTGATGTVPSTTVPNSTGYGGYSGGNGGGGSPAYPGAGGGGAGGNGSTPPSSSSGGGAGGPGRQINLVGYGNYYWGGGGGGSSYTTGAGGGTGGQGGGGGGSCDVAPAGAGGQGGLNNGSAGTAAANSTGGAGGANTGGGGGSGAHSTGQGGTGGSGIVIIRYAV
jgi:hypothetical protein